MKKIGKVVVIGGSGMVGRELLKVMKNHQIEPSKLIITGNKTIGLKEKTPYGEFFVQPSNASICKDADLVFLAAGAGISKELAYPILDANNKVKIIDLSSAYRYEVDVPLVIWPINGDTIGNSRLIATPNCTTSIILMALAPLHNFSPIKKINLASYQAASGGGKEALDDLETQIKMWHIHGEPPAHAKTGSHQYALAGNVIPHIDSAEPQWHGYTKEEKKCQWETNKILFRLPINDTSIPITATCVRVPVIRSHSAVVTVLVQNPVLPKELNFVWQMPNNRPYLVVKDNLAQYDYPMPINMTGKEEVGVGRLRLTNDHSGRELTFFVCGDQLLRGAALSAVEIAENIF